MLDLERELERSIKKIGTRNGTNPKGRHCIGNCLLQTVENITYEYLGTFCHTC